VVSGRKFEVSIGTDQFRSGISIRCQPDEIEGADEIDRVMNIGWLMEENYHLVEEDLKVVRSAIGEAILLKVIIESTGAQSYRMFGLTHGILSGHNEILSPLLR
jgi:hypothetical protein